MSKDTLAKQHVRFKIIIIIINNLFITPLHKTEVKWSKIQKKNSKSNTKETNLITYRKKTDKAMKTS